ncbi:MAG: hypothetical protein KGM24_01330 [Elusimicrobia bacterium]|nr:hypothetical protein [Elusimicrobiota bacterium]
MSDRTTRRLIGSVLLLGALSACGRKKPKPAVRPDLTMPAPEPTGPFKAQKEVSASKGAVKLTLRLYRTKVKADPARWKGASLWLQLEMTNVGRLPFDVGDDLFYEPTEPPVDEGGPVNGIVLRVFDGKGRLLEYVYTVPCDQQMITDPSELPMWRRIFDEVRMPGAGFLKPAARTPWAAGELAKVRELRRKWRRQGVDNYDIEVKSIRFLRGEQEAEAEKDERQRIHTLPPGGSVVSAPFAEDEQDDDCRSVPGRPLGPYSELRTRAFFPELVPGKRYFIQAVYDERAQRAFIKSLEAHENAYRRRHPAYRTPPALRKMLDSDMSIAVRVETPRIEFEVER